VPSVRPRARVEPTWKRGLGAESGGQSGCTERISRAEVADSESVEELLEEGQAFEAGVVDGVENAPDADQGEVRTREVPEDDVQQEYLDEDWVRIGSTRATTMISNHGIPHRPGGGPAGDDGTRS
jgi:hypothetical protein